MSTRASTIKVALWHLRDGGFRRVRLWRKRNKAGQNPFRERYRNVTKLFANLPFLGPNLAFEDCVLPIAAPRRDIRVAVILDDFSSLAFSYEWESVAITPANWRDELVSGKPDLLFVESAWSGNSGQWKFQLVGPTGPKASFRDLVDSFREQGVPTVFWNKEDPPHYHDFLEAASLFDYVFTSDSDRIEDYQRDLGHERVAVLPFAAQPRIHNPVRPLRGWRERNVGFAGMYFAHKYPERMSQLHMLLNGAIDATNRSKNGVEIFSRQAKGSDIRYQFPAPYDTLVVGSLSYRQMLTAYKAYKVFLNVNSVVNSPTMCARRIFEISASGTPVVSADSRAISNFFPPSEIHVVNERKDTASTVRGLLRNPEVGDRQVHLAQRRIWGEHTYSHRVETVLGAALPHVESLPKSSISVIMSTIRPQQLEHVLRTIHSQRGREVELVLLTHGFEVCAEKLRSALELYPVENLTLLHGSAGQSLGECLNLCVSAASGETITKMDDDDFYAENYLEDQLNALIYSGAEVVGKQAHYMYLKSLDATVLRFAAKEHRYTSLVMGPTIMASKSTFLEFPFEDVTIGEDTRFLRAVGLASGSIYSSDRFNYCQQRNDNGHTWRVSDRDLLATGDITFFGRPNEHISI